MDKIRAAADYAADKSDDVKTGMKFLKNLGEPTNFKKREILAYAKKKAESTLSSKLDVLCKELSTTRSYNALTGNSDDVLRLEFIRKGVVSKKLAERKALIQDMQDKLPM